MRFREWLVIAEESGEQRAAREREAARRAELWNDYAEKARRHSSQKPEGPIGPSPEWLAHIKSSPQSPIQNFEDEVEEEIFRLIGKSWRHGAIIDGSVGGKEEADGERLHHLIRDSYDDGTSPEEAAKMAVDLARSMGYLN